MRTLDIKIGLLIQTMVFLISLSQGKILILEIILGLDRIDDVEPIIPEQSFYEIVLIRPKTIDDINYVVDQVLEEKNPVLLDLSFLESESPANFKLAGEKIKQMRTRYGAQALLLSRSSEKNLIILSPKKVRLVKKN